MKRFKRLFNPDLTWKEEANAIDQRLAPILEQIMKDYKDYDPHDLECVMNMAIACTVSGNIIQMQAENSKRRSAVSRRRMEERRHARENR